MKCEEGKLTSETLNENVGRTKLVRASVLLDEGSVARSNSGLAAERSCPGDGGLCVGHCLESTSTTLRGIWVKK